MHCRNNRYTGIEGANPTAHDTGLSARAASSVLHTWMMPLKVRATSVKLAMPPPTNSARVRPSGFAVALHTVQSRSEPQLHVLSIAICQVLHAKPSTTIT